MAWISTDWTKRYTGFPEIDNTDPVLWNNAYTDWYEHGSKAMNYPSFYLNNLNDVPGNEYRLTWDELVWAQMSGRW